MCFLIVSAVLALTPVEPANTFLNSTASSTTSNSVTSLPPVTLALPWTASTKTIKLAFKFWYSLPASCGNSIEISISSKATPASNGAQAVL